MGKLIFIHAQTSMHPGSGTALGAVDLTVQRERHTMWPVIQGSSLKGVIRDKCRSAVAVENGDSDKHLADNSGIIPEVFGPSAESGDSSDHAGAVSFTDARVLLYPLRSLKGVFAWITCAAALERLARDSSLAGCSIPAIEEVLSAHKGENTALAAPQCPCVVKGENKILLEDFDFSFVASDAVSALGEWIGARAICADDAFNLFREKMKTNLVVLSDDDFTHFVRYNSQIEARIALDYDRKTVKQGALFYQEFLPPETLFYSVLIGSDSHVPGSSMSAADVEGFISGKIDSQLLQVGGAETIGKGFCRCRVSGKEAS